LEIHIQLAIISFVNNPRSTVVSRIINAPREAVYQAYLDPEAVAAWLPPGSMTGVVHAFDAREGGTFSMSLVYAEAEDVGRGKTSETTDTFQGRFVKLVPGEQVVWATEFESADPTFAGEMTITTNLASVKGGTDVTVVCENIPPGIRLEDNETGCRMTLDQLADFLDG
jgi:uncharacterized protein YndB with AHSA1/START domain